MNHLPLADQIAALAAVGDVAAIAVALDGHAPRGSTERDHPAVIAHNENLRREWRATTKKP